jgi:hypothetical protein
MLAATRNEVLKRMVSGCDMSCCEVMVGWRGGGEEGRSEEVLGVYNIASAEKRSVPVQMQVKVKAKAGVLQCLETVNTPKHDQRKQQM